MKRRKYLPFSSPSLGKTEIKAITKVLKTPWITTGVVTKSFEEEFASYTGAPYAIAVNSCTSGLFMVYQSLNIQKGDEIIVPAMTWPATANAAVIAGATVVFADIDYRTMCITKETIEPCVTKKTKAIVLVHFAGLSCKLKPIIELCKERKIPIVEDAAHAVGTRYNGKHIGGDYAYATTYSFHPIKNMTTGEGGMVTCHKKEVYERLNLFKFHGITRDSYKIYSKDEIPGYDLLFPSLKFNQPDILSAIGRVQLRKLEQFNAKRRELAEYYLKELSGVKGIDLPISAKGHAWHLFVIKINGQTGMAREELIVKLKNLNIGTGIHFLPVNDLKYYRKKIHTNTVNAQLAGKSCISLPLCPSMTKQDVNYVASCIGEILQHDRQ